MSTQRLKFSATRFLTFAVPAYILLLQTGCSKSPYDLAPVSGKVTVDGQPLPDGQVMFAPRATSGSAKAGKPALGNVRPDGTFSLSTYADGDGAVVGEHLITLYGPAPEISLPSGIPPFEKVTLPGRQVRVEAGTNNTIDIAITAADLKPLKVSRRQAKR